MNTKNDVCIPRTTRDLALKLGLLVSKLAISNEESGTSLKAAVFHRAGVPNITLEKYSERLVDMLYITPECYAIAAVYLTRLAKIVTPFTAHRLMLTAVVVAAKNQDDLRAGMGYWSKVGGVPKPQLVEMEAELLEQLNFSTFVDCSTYQKALTWLASASQKPRLFLLIPKLTSQKRGATLSDKADADNVQRRYSTTSIASTATNDSSSSTNSVASTNTTTSTTSFSSISKIFPLRAHNLKLLRNSNVMSTKRQQRSTHLVAHAVWAN